MQNDAIAFLRLLQLADSALPVGAAAHSFGLETLVAEGWLTVATLETFLRDYLAESGTLECTFCLLGYRLAPQLAHDTANDFMPQWLALNARLGAFKTARESRQASATLGRRFLQLAQGLDIHPLLSHLVQAAKVAATETYHSIAFGLVSGLLCADAQDVPDKPALYTHTAWTATGLAYLQQSLTGLVSACQRLLPLGQSQASHILWHLHSTVLATVERSEAAATDNDISSFSTLVDISSMRHPALTTRLFIS